VKKSSESMKAHTNSSLLKLSETFKSNLPFVEANIDRDNSIIKNICLLTSESRNGREYLPQAIEQAAALFEGVKAFANHPRKSERGEVRDVRDLIGKCKNVRYSQGKLMADLFILESHSGWIFPLATQTPELVGISINAQGKVRKVNGKDVVEEIVEVRSVDLVSEPAATKNLFEDAVPNDEAGFYSGLTVEKLQQHRPDLVDEILIEKDTVINQLKEEIQALKDELNSYKEKEKQGQKESMMKELIKDSKLKDENVTEVFKNTLLKLNTDNLVELREEMSNLIADREKLIAKSSGLVKRMGHEKEGSPPFTMLSNETFINVIKGERS
jgi:hypothetical protein